MELKRLPIIFIFLLISVFAQAQANFDTSPYKIALSFDGNAHDADDIVAAPMALAIIAEAGLKDRVVHVDYSNHIWDDQGSNKDEVADQVKGMKEAIQGTISHWNYASQIFFEARISSDYNAAKSNFKGQVAEAYSKAEQLYYLLGGPMEVPYQCIAQVPSYQRNRITAISHSSWNETHAHNSSKTWKQIKTMGVKTVKIADQNTYDCGGCGDDNDMSTTQFDKWKWLANKGGKYKWLYDQNPFTNKFDASDAGMAWWVITGRPGVNSGSSDINIRYNDIEGIYATPAKIEALFKDGSNDGGGGGDPVDPDYLPIPGQIEAEDFSSHSGVQEETTKDNGGGMNIGYINGGDWMEYKVDAATSGNYEIIFRVASSKNGGKIEIKKGSTLLSTVNVPVTGGWQKWTNVSTTAGLSKGPQTLRLNFVGNSGYLFNINWIKFALDAEVPPTSPPPAGSDYFFIVNKESGKKIRPYSDNDDASMVQAPSGWEDDILQWEEIPTENGYFYLKNKATGKYFRPASDDDFSEIIQKPASYSGDYTQWKKIDTNDGYFHLENRATGKRIRATSTVDMASGTNYHLEQARINWTGDWVRWKFVEVNAGARLANNHESKPFSANENLSPVEEILGETTDIKVYPNPATTYLNISGITPDTQMEVFDMRGNVLMGISGQNNVNVAALPAGMYLLSIDGKMMQRFIKE